MAEDLPAVSLPRGRVLVKPPCLNPLFGRGRYLTCHTWVSWSWRVSLVPGILIQLLRNLEAFRHSTSCPFPRSPNQLLAELLVSVQTLERGYREGTPSRERVSMLQLLVLCQHTHTCTVCGFLEKSWCYISLGEGSLQR